MNNQDRYIPEHMKHQWDETVDELVVTSRRRHEAEELYRQTLLKRLAAPDEVNLGEYNLTETVQELVEANRHYTHVTMARLALSDHLKSWQMNTYFNHDVA